MTAPDPGAASSARDEAVRVVYAAVEALPLGADEGVAMATSVDALLARPDVLAALAAEAGLVVPDAEVERLRAVEAAAREYVQAVDAGRELGMETYGQPIVHSHLLREALGKGATLAGDGTR